jgi:hypothetical protein
MPRGVYDRTKKTKGAQASAKKSSKKNGHQMPEVLKLDELTLYKMRMLDAEMKALQSDVLIQKGVKEGLLAKADPTGVLKKLDDKVQLLTANYHQKAEEYKALRDEVGERLGIDMKDYAYDDTTGVLHDLSAAPPEPLPTEKSKTVQ